MTYVDLFEFAVRSADGGGRIEVGECRMTGDAGGREPRADGVGVRG